MTSISTRTKAGSTHPTDSNLSAEDVLVQPDWLAEHLHDDQVRIIEVDVGDTAYTDGHIDGAAFWNIYRDLKDREYRTVDHAAIRRLIERSGVDEHTTVIFYGHAPAMGFWFMKLMGHADVRTELEFVGERFWPSGGMDPAGRAGHIPSTVNLLLEDLYEPDGAFRGPAELETVFATFDPPTGGEVITSCTIGARACAAWFVLSYLLGWPEVACTTAHGRSGAGFQVRRSKQRCAGRR